MIKTLAWLLDLLPSSQTGSSRLEAGTGMERKDMRQGVSKLISFSFTFSFSHEGQPSPLAFFFFFNGNH